ncbi:hypothetical protein K8T06_02740, partial [bacterium]|nr:hypothetical protein [bacterium]
MTVGAGIGVTVEFKDKAKVKQILLDSILTVTGETIDKISNLFDGVGSEKLNKLMESIEKKITKASEAKLGAAYKCTYSKIKQEEAILQVRLPAPVVSEHQSDMLRCDLRAILDYATNHPNTVVIERYMRQKSVETRFAWGFSLG